jgi:hypothetical protein
MNNLLGKRGESLFVSSITRHVPHLKRIFDPSFLGDKFPDIDFYVSLMNYSLKKAFFLANVKTTEGMFYDVEKKKLRISIHKDRIDELLKFQLPVYIFGIDELTENIYFICANNLPAQTHLNGIPVIYPLDLQNLVYLYEEVKAYYDTTVDIKNFKSIFT